jgi:EEF1A lysine methyltransferase 2
LSHPSSARRNSTYGTLSLPEENARRTAKTFSADCVFFTNFWGWRSWDALYTTELSNHEANPSDEGTVWFDDSQAEAKLIRLFDRLESNGDGQTDTTNPERIRLNREETAFLDLGCGNGSLLFALREDGWTGKMLGVDYSELSVELAKEIGCSRFESEEAVGNIQFRVWDVLRGEYSAVLVGKQEKGWDAVLDKGTFDAICLSDERDADGKRVCEGYRDRVLGCVKIGGLFVVTSCNWTEDELRGWFLRDDETERFVEEERIEYRAISFGGLKGQTISTLCFRKVC